MKQVAVVYHSGYGHTHRMADHVCKGADAVEGVSARLVSVDAMDDDAWTVLADADGIIFGAPTYMGSVSAPFKAFMDASSKVWFSQGWKDKVAAGFTNSASQSGDKLNSLVQLMVFAGQHGMLWTSLGLMPGNNSSTGSAADLNRIGSYSGAMAQSNADQGAEAMNESDLRTAEHLGRRVAETVLRLS
ncbi:flavodoxin family protein [Nitrogeniibacter mangrovi]|uniref:Flavoprotein WrbA n=1 Tax=Nitrogeniibacter mangrovi TaxID=2016596 RepID=A0A6C1B9A4_9RHOO|nr:flavodoxin family protein [Nitrogeniibacter mangrovi]QID18920.1 flavodoxin family protein [Nitrogeniibacter mangrovi]